MVLYHRIPEFAVPGKPLGRHVHHDIRSLGFLFHDTWKVIEDKVWPRHIPILDQGSLGSCTGNAMVGDLGTSPDFEGLPSNHPALDENEAVHLYSEATKLDPYQGTYPPDDTGSDGLSVAKAAKNDGLISGYQHCTTLDSTLQALMNGPVIIGINWYSSFDNPDPDGTIRITSNAYVRGGHEVVLRSVDTVNSKFGGDNSWGPDWGNNGSFKMSYTTFTRLMSEDGDCTVPIPLSQPAPTPSPVFYTTDGNQSLLNISVSKGSPVSTILRTTLQQYEKFSANMSHYLQRGDMTAAMPAGESLCLAWPQHQFC